jgi:uncharacterized delta-60 repeat protein
MSIRVNKGKFKINAIAKAVLTFIPPTPTPTATPTTTPTATVGTSPTPTASITASPTLTRTPTITPTPSITASQTVTPSNTTTATQTPTPSITASQTLTPSNTATQTQTPTPSITASQTVTPSITATQTQTPTPSITASQTPTQGSTPTPTITQTQTPTPSITASQTVTPSITATPTFTPTPSITASQTVTPSNTTTKTQTPTPSITASQTVTPSITATPTFTPTPSITASQTVTPSITATPTFTPTPSITASQTQTSTSTATQTQTPTPSITASQTQTPTNTITQTQTPTPSITASQTVTPTNTATRTQTPTPSITASQTQTPTPSITASQTQTPTPSITASQTQTPTQTQTPSNTATRTQTPTPSITASQTQTPTPSITASQTQTPTPSITASQTQTPTPSITASQTQTPTPSITASQTQTQTPTNTSTQTQTNTPTPTQTPTNALGVICVGGTSAYPYVITNGPDNNYFIGGSFGYYNGSVQNNLVKVNEDGTKNTSFNIGSGPNHNVKAIGIASGSKVFIGGEQITGYDGTGTGAIVKINSNGSIDSSFTSLSFGDQYTSKWVLGLSELSNGKLLVVGDFAYYGASLATNGIILNSDGSFNINLDTNTNGYTRSAVVQTNNMIVAGGLGGSTIERVSTGGTKDTTFNTNHGTISGYLPSSPNAFPDVFALALQNDGKIVAVGSFTSVNGYSRSGIVRLNTDGTVDTGFNPGTAFDKTAYTVKIQSDGKIVVGGDFTTYNGTSRSKIVRINSDGSIDTGFTVGTGFNAEVDSLILIRSNIYSIGAFTTYDGMDTTVVGDYVAALDTNGGILNCPSLTPTPTPTTTETPTPTPTTEIVQVYINVTVTSQADCQSNYNFCAHAVDQYNIEIAVDANLTVYGTWTGDLSGSFDYSVTILQGNYCGTQLNDSGNGVSCIGEYYSNATINVLPYVYGNQTYNPGGITLGNNCFC